MSLSSPGDNTPSPSEGPSTSNDEEEQKNGKMKTNQDVLDDVDKLFQLFQDEWKAVSGTKQRKSGAKKKSVDVSEPGTSGVANTLPPTNKPKSSLPKSQSPFAIAVFKAVAPYAHLLIEGKETSGQNKMTWDKIHAEFVATNPEMDQPGLRRRMQVAWAMKKYNTKRKKGPLNEVDKTIVKAVEQSHAIIPVKPTPPPTEPPPTKRPRKSTPRKVEFSDQESDPLDALLNKVVANTTPKTRGRPRKRSIKEFEAISEATTANLTKPIHSATLYVTPTSPTPLNLADLRAKSPNFAEKTPSEGEDQMSELQKILNRTREEKDEPESTEKSTEKSSGNAPEPHETSNVVLSFENMLKVLEICRKNNYSYDIQQDTLIFKDNTKKTKDVIIPINLIHHLSL